MEGDVYNIVEQIFSKRKGKKKPLKEVLSEGYKGRGPSEQLKGFVLFTEKLRESGTIM